MTVHVDNFRVPDHLEGMPAEQRSGAANRRGLSGLQVHATEEILIAGVGLERMEVRAAD